ncbi:MAG: UDP-N-acetylglucosamine 2-epimerase (non-hydrolyzing) [Nitrososphaerota archaeon]|nr:UDP-N-acetylglucosamine 2-epimerase (non-hydrolyzing) [Nitrososphaerota archaeon]
MKVLTRDELGDSICVVLGTRPGIIKMSPIIKELDNRGMKFFVVHTGQHYSRNMSEDLFSDLELPRPEYHVEGVDESYFHGEQTSIMLTGVENALLKERPTCTLVGGDANTNLAGGLAARKLGIMVGHIEAGLRSNDWRMPEEHNRVMLDHISEYLFAPTTGARQNLIRDRVRGRIYVVGNTIADAVIQNRETAQAKSTILTHLHLSPKEFIVLTAHREENVDNPQRLRLLSSLLAELVDHIKLPVIFSVHPRTERRIKQFNLSVPQSVVVLPALGYLDFLNLLDNASFVITDSGGIQEEACILRVPCVTIRDNTERPETVKVGANVVTGLDRTPFLDGCRNQMLNDRSWRNPYAPGAAKRIVSILDNELFGGRHMHDGRVSKA